MIGMSSMLFFFFESHHRRRAPIIFLGGGVEWIEWILILIFVHVVSGFWGSSDRWFSASRPVTTTQKVIYVYTSDWERWRSERWRCISRWSMFFFFFFGMVDHKSSIIKIQLMINTRSHLSSTSLVSLSLISLLLSLFSLWELEFRRRSDGVWVVVVGRLDHRFESFQPTHNPIELEIEISSVVLICI